MTLDLPEYNVRQIVDLISWSSERGYFDDGISALKFKLLEQSGLKVPESGRLT